MPPILYIYYTIYYAILLHFYDNIRIFLAYTP